MPDAAEVAAVLRRGGVAVLPTDTVYGLAASPEHVNAVARVFALKRRPLARNLPVMVASAAQIAALGARIPPIAQRLLHSRFMPGPLTLALPVETPVAWLAGRGEVAVRIPDHAMMLDILERTGPLFVTSANAHGATTERSLSEVLAQLDGAPDLAVDGGPLGETPSTLVNCAVSPFMIEREGAVSAEEIRAVLS